VSSAGNEIEKDCSVSMLAANLLVYLSAGPVAAALALAYAVRWGAPSLGHGIWTLLDLRLFLLTVLPGILAHELIHAAGWAVFARRRLRDIRIGVRWQSMTPYAHPKHPMPVEAYRAGAVMPAIVMGLAPALASIAVGTPVLMAWSLVFVLAAGGDLVVLWLIRGVPRGRLVADHPTRAGCMVMPG
jgi:hypothetical protein